MALFCGLLAISANTSISLALLFKLGPTTSSKTRRYLFIVRGSSVEGGI